MSKTYLSRDPEFLTFGPYRIHMNITGAPEFIYENMSAILESNIYRYSHDIPKQSICVVLDASNHVSYDCSVTQDFYMASKDGGKFGECDINHLAKFTRVISNIDGYLSDDIEIVLPDTMQVSMNSSCGESNFVTNHSKKMQKLFCDLVISQIWKRIWL